ncbi:MAG: hypothetical protein PHP31_08945 [Lentimicrobiaceae bacterium]|nr:hypothetical protein [Lentimicrobiaceae bacterium]
MDISIIESKVTRNLPIPSKNFVSLEYVVNKFDIDKSFRCEILVADRSDMLKQEIVKAICRMKNNGFEFKLETFGDDTIDENINSKIKVIGIYIDENEITE